jgi:hypothetical protein
MTLQGIAATLALSLALWAALLALVRWLAS